MRYTGPKNKVARREGVDLGLKTPGSKSHARLLKKLNIRPGQHGARGRRKVSERGRQIRESQKLKFLFGITAQKAKNYFKRAVKKTGNSAFFISQFLEKRLDNVVYRLGFAPTRAAARQLVCHKHFKVNDKRVSIPSLELKIGDVIMFANEKSQKIPDVIKAFENKDVFIAPWLQRKAFSGKLTSEPTSELIEQQINLRLVIEYFSH